MNFRYSNSSKSVEDRIEYYSDYSSIFDVDAWIIIVYDSSHTYVCYSQVHQSLLF